MTIKMFEIRDSATMISAMCVEVRGEDSWLLQRAGFGETPCYILTNLSSMESQYDPYSWRNHRTMGTAHEWIRIHWAELESGDMVDVEYILNERPTPKTSERVLYGSYPPPFPKHDPEAIEEETP